MQFYGFLKRQKNLILLKLIPENAIGRLVDLVVDHVAKTILSNVRETKTQDVVLEFFNIKSRKEFERLLAYLSALEQIEKVFVKSIEATSLKLEIFVKGGLKGFEQCVLYSEVLQRTSNRNPLQYNFLDKRKIKMYSKTYDKIFLFLGLIVLVGILYLFDRSLAFFDKSCLGLLG